MTSPLFKAAAARLSGKSKIDLSATRVTLTKTPTALPPAKDLVFGRCFSDHMLTIPWSASKGWAAPVSRLRRPFSSILSTK